jgi:TPR repeat protein
MYYNGEGTLTDKKTAASWIKLSYENGFEKAKETWDDLELWKY